MMIRNRSSIWRHCRTLSRFIRRLKTLHLKEEKKKIHKSAVVYSSIRRRSWSITYNARRRHRVYFSNAAALLYSTLPTNLLDRPVNPLKSSPQQRAPGIKRDNSSCPAAGTDEIFKTTARCRSIDIFWIIRRTWTSTHFLALRLLLLPLPTEL